MSADLNGRMLPHHGGGVLLASVPLGFQGAMGVALRSTFVLHHASFLGQTEREQSVDTRAWLLPNPATTTPTSHAEAAWKAAILATREDRAHD